MNYGVVDIDIKGRLKISVKNVDGKAVYKKTLNPIK